jgi:hypothetical protein
LERFDEGAPIEDWNYVLKRINAKLLGTRAYAPTV